MQQIKTLSFVISNSQSLNKARGSQYYEPMYDNPEVTSWAKIDKEVSKAMSKLNVVDVKINDATINRHNNGGSDTIVRTYTIIYNAE